MSNPTIDDIKKELKKYKIPSSLNKPELLILLGNLEKLKEENIPDAEIKSKSEELYRQLKGNATKSKTGELIEKVKKKSETKELIKEVTDKKKRKFLNEYNKLHREYLEGKISNDAFAAQVAIILSNEDITDKDKEKIQKSFEFTRKNTEKFMKKDETTRKLIDSLQKRIRDQIKLFEMDIISEQQLRDELEIFKSSTEINDELKNAIEKDVIDEINKKLEQIRSQQQEEEKQMEPVPQEEEKQMEQNKKTDTRIKKIKEQLEQPVVENQFNKANKQDYYDLLDKYKSGNISSDEFKKSVEELLRLKNFDSQDRIEIANSYDLITKDLKNRDQRFETIKNILDPITSKIKDGSISYEDAFNKLENLSANLKSDEKTFAIDLLRNTKINEEAQVDKNIETKQERLEESIVENTFNKADKKEYYDLLEKYKFGDISLDKFTKSVLELLRLKDFEIQDRIEITNSFDTTTKDLENREERFNTIRTVIDPIINGIKDGSIKKDEAFEKLRKMNVDLKSDEKTFAEYLIEGTIPTDTVNSNNVYDIIKKYENGEITYEQMVSTSNPLIEKMNKKEKKFVFKTIKEIDDKIKQKQNADELVNNIEIGMKEFEEGKITGLELLDKYINKQNVPNSEQEKYKEIINNYIDQVNNGRLSVRIVNENAALEASVQAFNEQERRRKERERNQQEIEEKADIPYKTVDVYETSDPPTGTLPQIDILNNDQEKQQNPNLPINMQPEYVMKSMDPELSTEQIKSKQESEQGISTTPVETIASVLSKIKNLLITNSDANITSQISASDQSTNGPSIQSTTEPIPSTTSVPLEGNLATSSDGSGPPPDGSGPQPTDQAQTNIPIDTAPQGDKTGIPFTVETTYEVKYHKAQVNEFFSSVDNPNWDSQLNRSITGNYDNGYFDPVKETLFEHMNQMITNKNLKIYKLATTMDSDEKDVLTEYVIISQIHFCVLRNLQRGERTKTAMIPLKSLIELRNNIAGQQQQINNIPNASTDPNMQPTPTEVSNFNGENPIPNVLKQDITIKDISEKFRNRKFRGNVILYDDLYKNIVKSGREHSGGNNIIFGPSNLYDPLGLEDDTVNPYKNKKFVIKTTNKH